jgi:hypothetical protein
MNCLLNQACLALQATQLSLPSPITLGKVAEIALLVLVAWIAIRWLSKLFGLLSSKIPRSRFLMRLLEPVSRIGIWFIVIFAIIRIFAPSQQAFLASLASLGLAVGLGAQDLIKNVIGGLIILIDRPYQLGDRVKIGDAYGEIDHVGLRSTKMTTPDDTRVTIPNLDILNPDVAIEIGYEAAACSPFLLARKSIVTLVTHGFDRRPFLRLRIKSYVYDHRYEPRMISDITSRATKEFIRLGILQKWQGTVDETAPCRSQ